MTLALIMVILILFITYASLSMYLWYVEATWYTSVARTMLRWVSFGLALAVTGGVLLGIVAIFRYLTEV